LTETIPSHLLAWTVEQRPELYTAIDHAVWRYVLRVSGAYFRRVAHPAYLEGLRATGLQTERVPRIDEMDAAMRRLGWRAVAVSGFIPPQVFMEFQSLGILPIACDMRLLEHALYTPAPDVIHEAAGHAPIIADPDYRDYLRAYGEISRQAVYSDEDMRLYRAIRRLSELKEEADADPGEVAAAQRAFEELAAAMTELSEAAELARMYWWTVEYGLVGPLDDPKIYGAGLLSSAGESWRCLRPEVAKVPLTVDCVKTAYDITRPQPQLFVTPDFPHLRAVLEEFAATMACRTGGVAALDKALAAKAPEDRRDQPVAHRPGFEVFHFLGKPAHFIITGTFIRILNARRINHFDYIDPLAARDRNDVHREHRQVILIGGPEQQRVHLNAEKHGGINVVDARQPVGLPAVHLELKHL